LSVIAGVTVFAVCAAGVGSCGLDG
jgi:hypothetical protein